MRSVTRGVAAASLALAVCATSAQADIFGTFENSPTGIGSTDPSQLLKFNVGSGGQVSLPAPFQSPVQELHPSISRDGKRMVFSRIDPVGGTRRTVVVDLTTGQSADLFTAFEAGDPQLSPVFSLDGTKVLTGRALERIDPASPDGTLQASVTETSLANFPNGPFPHTVFDLGGPDHTRAGRVKHLTVSPSGRIGYTLDFDAGQDQAMLRNSATVTRAFLEQAETRNPTVSESNNVAVVEKTPAGGSTQLAFRSLDDPISATTPLPALINAPGQEVSRPQFSQDGRYLAFVRRSAGNFPRLFVWDSQTQLLLNDQGAGVLSGNTSFEPTARADGAIALQVVPVFTKTSVQGPTISFSTAVASDVGILVQRIVGRTKVLGRTAPRLRLVGRVPFGRFAAGKTRRVKWDLRVDGKKLRKGKYLITPRSVAIKGDVVSIRDLGKPRRIRIR